MIKKEKLLLVLIAAGFTLLLIGLAYDNHAVWFDEVFTLKLVTLPYSEIMLQTAMDVHPPLYYILLKTFLLIVDPWNHNMIVWCKIFSILPIALLMIMGSLILHKDYNFKIAVTFLVCLFGTRIVMYAVEIRMYSLAIFFVTMAFIYGDKVRKENSFISWLGFTSFALLAAYTHYYSIISLSLLYFYLLFWSMKHSQLRRWIVNFMIIVLLYLPWLVFVLQHLPDIGEGWSFSLNILDLVMFAVFPFYTNSLWLTGFLIIITVTVVISLLFNFKKNQDDRFIAMIICNPIYTAILGVLLSVMVGKFFSGKYLLPVWGAFWMGISIQIWKMKKPQVYLALFFFCNALTFGLSFIKENEDRKGYYKLQEWLVQWNDQEVYCDPTLAEVISVNTTGPHLKFITGIPNTETMGSIILVYSDYFEWQPGMTELDTFSLGGARVSVIINGKNEVTDDNV